MEPEDVKPLVEDIVARLEAIRAKLIEAENKKPKRHGLFESDWERACHDYSKLTDTMSATMDSLQDLGQALHEPLLKSREELEVALRNKIAGLEAIHDIQDRLENNADRLIAAKDARISELEIDLGMARRQRDIAESAQIKVEERYAKAIGVLGDTERDEAYARVKELEEFRDNVAAHADELEDFLGLIRREL